MLRTNSKKAMENIRTYIEENFDCTGYEPEKEPETFKEKACFILETCKKKKKYSSFNLSDYEIFKGWCQGLPSLLDTCYYYNRSAVDDLAEILEETEEEKRRFTDSEAEEKLTYLIYRELSKAERSEK